MQTSSLAMQIALSGAARVRQGETPNLKRPSNLSELHGQQNLDFFEESFQDLKSRDNASGEVSIHMFTPGPDQDPAEGKLKIGDFEAELDGDTTNGTRYSVETRGEVQKIKSHRFEEDRVVVYEATVKPGNDVNTSVLILDRTNPENSQMGRADTDWLLGL